MRRKCYEDLLEPYTEESRRKAKIVRHTMDGEVIRTKFCDIRRVVKPAAVSSLSRVLIPRLRVRTDPHSSDDLNTLLQSRDADDIVWETIAERDEIERHLTPEYNRASFRAESESPCGHEVIHDAITFSSLSPASMNLLEGEIPYEWHKDDEALKALLTSFASIHDKVKQEGEISTEISAEDVFFGFKNWRETKTTSPSSGLLGHYRSLIQNPVLLSCFVKFKYFKPFQF